MDLDEIYNKVAILLENADSDRKTIPKDFIIYLRKKINKDVLNEYCIVCNLSFEHKVLLKSKVLQIKFSIDSMIKNQISHPDLKLQDYKKIEKILKNYDEIFFDKKKNLRFFKNVDGKFYEIVIKTTKNGEENFLTTFHRCDESKIKNLKR